MQFKDMELVIWNGCKYGTFYYLQRKREFKQRNYILYLLKMTDPTRLECEDGMAQKPFPPK